MSSKEKQKRVLTYRRIAFCFFFLISIVIFPHNEIVPSVTPSSESSETEPGAEISEKQADFCSDQTEPFHIGVVQFAEHQALDLAYSGILDALEESGLKQGQHIIVDYHNSRGNPDSCRVTVEKFTKDGADLIVAIATPSAQAAVEQKEIPVLFAAVTEPQEAGLVETWDRPNTNATGVSDLTPVEALLDMTMEVVPDAENIGVVYNNAEVNSVVQVELSEQIAQRLGVNIVKVSAGNPEEVGVMAEKLVDIADVIWVPTDNTVLSAFDKLIEIMEKHKIPVVGASTEFAKAGAMYATGYDYYVLGFQAGDMAVEIIGGADPAVMPVRISTEIHIAINMHSAEKIGYRIPFEVLLITDQIFFE